MPRAAKRDLQVFLNVPFDAQYEPMLVALISCLLARGYLPRCVIEVESQGHDRLDRLVALILQCGSSIHDLSRVELSPDDPQVPRFNMPFELGLAIGLAKRTAAPHRWFVLESKAFRLHKSLSDVMGYDHDIHGDKPAKIWGIVASHFVSPRKKPQDPALVRKFQKGVQRLADDLKKHHGTELLQAVTFRELVQGASAVADETFGG